MSVVLEWIRFFASVKGYVKKQQTAKQKENLKKQRREKAKINALKGVGANKQVLNDIAKSSSKPLVTFETKVNMMMYEEGEKATEELRSAEEVIEQKKQYVKLLNRKKKSLLHQMEKEAIEKKRKVKAEDEKNYRLYQQELREKLRIFLSEKIREDKGYKSQMMNEHLFYAKMEKVKALAEVKKQWLEEFQKTIEAQEFNKKLDTEKAKERQVIHKEFIEKIMKDKEYKRELYLAEKLLDVMLAPKCSTIAW
eukprot:TRINITY_DN1055_c0_g4_i1.p2 TRINITY_DN1055_c0_g4~~TRINITY_DN1055_c0_g4_i1.p2  ORF type:complete len:252 (-),score=94.26 TRINITY_DN1055_c0_g4_i1:266-1021(-)